jgi:hypothetical protein
MGQDTVKSTVVAELADTHGDYAEAAQGLAKKPRRARAIRPDTSRAVPRSVPTLYTAERNGGLSR